MNSTTVVEQAVFFVGGNASALAIGGLLGIVAMANPLGATAILIGGAITAWGLTKKD